MMIIRTIAAFISFALLVACSDSDSNRGQPVVPPEPEYSVDPATIDVSEAEYCDITQGDHCLFPFPNDYFTREDSITETGLRVNFDGRAMPVNEQGAVIDATEQNRSDGFSIGTTMLTRVEGLDLEASGAATIFDLGASLDPDAPIQLIHARTGERQLIWAEIDQVPEPEEKRALMIRVGKTLQNGERYIVVLQNLVDTEGNPIEPSDAFKVYQEAIPSDITEIESRREHFESIFESLSGHGIARDELYLAWDFTTASVENTSYRALHMRDTGLASLSGSAPAVTIESVVDNSVEDDRDIGRVIEGTITVPNFMDNAEAAPGSRINYESDDPDALPAQFGGDGTVEVPFICVIPQVALVDAADGDTETQAVVVGHGLFGDRYTALGVGFGAELTNAMFCAMDWWGMSSADQINAFLQLRDLSLFPELPDRLHQAFLNKIFLSEAMVNAGGFQTLPAFQDDNGNPLFRRDTVQYNGISMGSAYGGALSALSPHFDYSVLDLAGMNWANVVRRSNVWSTFAVAYEPSYTDSLDQALGLSLVQIVWDRADSNGYANHITRDPFPGSKLSRVLIQFGIGDQILTETASELMQRSLGTRRHNPSIVEGRHIAVEPYIGIEPITSYPYEGNAVMHWDTGPFPIAGHDGTPLQRPENLPRNLGYDTHGLPLGQPGAWEQKATFWRTGVVIDVCGSQPCLADGYDGTPGVYDPANAPVEE
ncbi:MAG: hypothetical protein ABJK25_03965 [Halieaceae bacterium]